MHNRYNFITQDNLKNIESFRLWLKENIAEIYEDKKIPDEHLLIFEYLQDLYNQTKT